MEKNIYDIFLSCISPPLTYEQYKNILKEFKNIKNFLNLKDRQIEKIDFLTLAQKKNIIKNKHSFDPEKEKLLLKKSDIKFITINQKDYPQELKFIENPPIILFYKGELSILKNKLKIAIVGTRKPSSYGIACAKFFAKKLKELGFVIISGLALGIDVIAQKEVVKNSGKTIGVLGSGINMFHPKTNKNFAIESLKKNKILILSEFHPTSPPLKQNFPLRNRIISALSLGVIVIEGAKNSGSIITANYAIEQGKEVFAVPGSIFSKNSKAPHFLIKQGAKLIESEKDIIDELKLKIKDFIIKKESEKTLSKEEQIIKEIISQNHEVSINEIIEKANLPTSKVLEIIVSLEIKNIIKDIGGKKYIISNF